jgi:hypothetical protein
MESRPENEPKLEIEQFYQPTLPLPEFEALKDTVVVDEDIIALNGVRGAYQRIKNKIRPVGNEASIEAPDEIPQAPDNADIKLIPAVKDAWKAMQQNREKRRLAKEPETTTEEINETIMAIDDVDKDQEEGWDGFIDYIGASEVRRYIENAGEKQLRKMLAESDEIIDDRIAERAIQEKLFDKILPQYFGVETNQMHKVPHKLIKQLHAQVFDLKWDELNDLYDSEAVSQAKVVTHERGRLPGRKLRFTFDNSPKGVKLIRAEKVRPQSKRIEDSEQQKPTQKTKEQLPTYMAVALRLYGNIQEEFETRVIEVKESTEANGQDFDEIADTKRIRNEVFEEGVANYFRVTPEELSSGAVPDELQERLWELFDEIEHAVKQKSYVSRGNKPLEGKRQVSGKTKSTARTNPNSEDEERARLAVQLSTSKVRLSV